jgi:Carboxypeptidase regulatory-like domain/TonB dependent receptor
MEGSFMLKFHQWTVWIAVALVFASATKPAGAQLTRGFISGTVTDASQAVIPGVLVSITNKSTGISRETVSTDAGFYRFVAVEPGSYSVELKLAGFETRRLDNVTVSTAQEVTLNQTLNIVGVTQDVLVTETPGVELAKTNPTIERTFSERMVSDLPLPAARRDVTRLALLAPTVNRAPGSNEFSSNGQRARNTNFIIDGVDNNDYSVTLNSARVIPESIQEVQVQTTAYSAEFGRSSGAQVSLVTKGGTNQFHGQLWENYRGNWMEPISLANKRAQINDTARFVVNQFGADGGGPIFTNRTFFFGLLEKNTRREAPQASNATVATIPTPSGYASLFTLPLGPGQTLESRQAVLSALSFLQEVYPKVTNYDNPTTTPVNGVAVPVGTIRIPIANPYDLWYTSARIDHKLTNKDSLTYRYHLDKRDEPNLTSNRQFGTKWSAAQTIFRQNHALSYTRTVSPRFLNEARLAYVRSNLDFPENDPISPTVGIANFFTIGGLNAFPQGRLDHTWQYQDVATYTTGRNSLKFGLDLRRYWLSNRSQLDSKGTWSFPNLQDFLNNNANLLRQAMNDSSFVAKQWNHAYFFQDDLKATRDLTLNLGVRYEYTTIPLGFFGATDPALRAAGARGPVVPDKDNWAPRFGFAYSPSSPKGLLAALLGAGKTSIRGGFGVAYDILFYNIMVNTASNYPRVVNSDTTDNLNRFPTLAPKISTLPAFNPLTTSFTNATEDLQNPTTNFWTLSLQRELGNTLLEFGYAGNRSYHQIRQSQANPPILTAAQAATVLATGDTTSIPGAQARRLNPNWNARTLIESAAKAEYHAGYVRFDKRFSKGLQFGANYTFSANFSDGDELISGVEDITLSSPAVPQDFFNFKNEWSRSVFDRPHRFVVHYVYEIPWFSSAWATGALNRIFAGWEISGFTEAQSGQPFTIRTGTDTVGTTAGFPGNPANPPGRPNFNPGGIFITDPVTHDLRTFTIPLNGTGIVTAPLLANSMAGGGNLGRNTFRGPSFQQWNASLMKRITIKENLQIQLRSDFINIWNHNNFPNPEARMSSPTFGRNTAKLISDAREMLFSAKLKF